MSDPYDDEDLADAAEDLARELRAYREELEREHSRPEPPRGPLGLPRPPTPREVIRFADEYAIPTVIAVLEANIKLLEGLRGVIRMAEAGQEARERSREVRTRGRRAGETTADRATEVGRATLSKLEESLSDLRETIEGADLPEDREGRDLLADVRELQEEIDDRLREARDGTGSARDGRRGELTDGRSESPGDSRGSTEGSDSSADGHADRGDGRADRVDGREGSTGSRSGADANGSADAGEEADRDDRDEGVEIDVDAELDSLRERYREEDDEDGDEE